VNERFYELDDKKLQDLIIQVTGAESDSSVVKQTLSTLKTLKAFANFDAPTEIESAETTKPLPLMPADFSARVPITSRERVGLNLSYTINLNLPATSDQAVFNAIFRSLKEHLLTDDE